MGDYPSRTHKHFVGLAIVKNGYNAMAEEVGTEEAGRRSSILLQTLTIQHAQEPKKQQKADAKLRRGMQEEHERSLREEKTRNRDAEVSLQVRRGRE